MRAFLAICAIALTACAAEPEAEAQSVEMHTSQSKSSSRTILTIARDYVPELRNKPEACVVAYTNVKIEQTAQSFGGLTKEYLIHDSANLIDSIDSCRLPEDLKIQATPVTQTLSCKGIAKQGGLVVCQTTPNARVEVGRSENDTYTQSADKDGVLLVGFDRDEPAAFVRVGEQRVDFDIEPREYDISRIDGLPKKFVSEYTPEQLKQIRKASALKKVGFASKVEEVGFKNGFIYPVTNHTKTTNFGAQRILNGEPKRPHFGVDLAAPKGTPILAPADGIVSLASEEMYFEGSLIMIDHGQGLISYYLHNEDVLVEEGQRVVQGEQIATVGSRGRSTGPHLCWRLKWRGRNLDPELLTEWPQKG